MPYEEIYFSFIDFGIICYAHHDNGMQKRGY
jgi:hypothetical protein